METESWVLVNLFKALANMKDLEQQEMLVVLQIGTYTNKLSSSHSLRGIVNHETHVFFSERDEAGCRQWVGPDPFIRWFSSSILYELEIQ